MAYVLNRRHVFCLAGYARMYVFLTVILGGCVAPLIAGIPNVVATEVLPRAVNGKGLAEDAVDLATNKDCRLIEGAVRKNRKYCEPKGSSQTRKDFKGLSGANH